MAILVQPDTLMPLWKAKKQWEKNPFSGFPVCSLRGNRYIYNYEECPLYVYDLDNTPLDHVAFQEINYRLQWELVTSERNSSPDIQNDHEGMWKKFLADVAERGFWEALNGSSPTWPLQAYLFNMHKYKYGYFELFLTDIDPRVRSESVLYLSEWEPFALVFAEAVSIYDLDDRVRAAVAVICKGDHAFKTLSVDVPSIRVALTRNPALPMNYIYEFSDDESPDVRASLASRKSLPDDVLDRLLKDSDPAVRHNMALNFSTPSKYINFLKDDLDAGVRRSVAAHPYADKETFPRLDHDTNIQTKRELAKRDVGEHSFAILAQDNDIQTRLLVAKNLKCPIFLLSQLSGDSSDDIRAAVASNWMTSPETLTVLAQDGRFKVRAQVGENPKTPPDVLESLAQDSEVKSFVIANSALPSEMYEGLMRDAPEKVLKQWIAHDACFIGVLEYALSEIANPDFYNAIARHPNATSEILDRLSRDSDPSVRRGVAKHPNTATSTLERLARDRDDDTRERAELTLKTRAGQDVEAKTQALEEVVCDDEFGDIEPLFEVNKPKPGIIRPYHRPQAAS